MPSSWYAALFDPLHHWHRQGGRPLRAEEIAWLRPVFGEELVYDRVRVHEDHWANRLSGGRSFVLGENIHLAAGAVGDAGVLVHEAAHVWQYQKTMGWEYLLRAIPEQMDLALGRRNPYDYEAVKDALPFEQWGVEQQAQWIQDHRRLPR